MNLNKFIFYLNKMNEQNNIIGDLVNGARAGDLERVRTASQWLRNQNNLINLEGIIQEAGSVAAERGRWKIVRFLMQFFPEIDNELNFLNACVECNNCCCLN